MRRLIAEFALHSCQALVNAGCRRIAECGIKIESKQTRESKVFSRHIAYHRDSLMSRICCDQFN